MPKPIQVLTPEELDSALDAWVPARKINQVHVHCTDHPNHSEFRGLASIEAMRRYHQSLGMADIAQHLTVDPRGLLWTGRPFDAMPASVRKHNGTTSVGPFMIEMVGLFEKGKDKFDDPQKAAVQAVVCSVLRKFGLTESAVRFHREFPNTGKTCPGSALDPKTFRKEIAALLGQASLTAEIALPRSVEREHLDRDALFARDLDENTQFAEVPEDKASVEEQVLLARWIDRGLLAPTSGALREIAEQYRELLPYVVNTSQGLLSRKGDFQTDEGQLENLVDKHLTQAFDSGECQHLLFYAHGGLVNEKSALENAKAIAPWWRANGIYPIFFIWESGLVQTIFQGRREMTRGAARGEFADKLLEGATQLLARKVWRRMKANARRCSAPDAGEGEAGGIYQFWEKLRPWLAARKGKVGLHAIGHSTGPILLARFMPLALDSGFEFSTLSYFAPAIRIDDFLAEVAPRIHRKTSAGIRRLRQYTMNDVAEREDDLLGIYSKSLLYYVRQACEDDADGRILGLERDLYGNPGTRALFGLPGAPSVITSPVNPIDPIAKIEFSVPADDFPQNPRTKATRHGCFDNEEATMTSALREILGNPIAVPSSLQKFPWSGASACKSSRDADLTEGFGAASEAPCRCCCQGSAAGGGETIGFGSDPDPEGSSPSSPVRPGRVGRRIALCVGIDKYPRQPLSGCVRDSRNWAAALRKVGFEIREIHDGEATRANLVRGLRDLLRDGASGDQLVFQFAGHGAQVEDRSGDERDPFDEVVVPVDFDQGALLIDDDIYQLCQELRAGATLTYLMDCCHSGTNTRFAPVAARASARAVPRFIQLSSQEIAAHEGVRRGMRSAPLVGERDPIPGVVSFAACSDREVAYEEDGQGIFSRHALAVIGTVLDGKGSNQDFLRAVLADFGGDDRQHPLLDKPVGGIENAPLLGGR